MDNQDDILDEFDSQKIFKNKIKVISLIGLGLIVIIILALSLGGKNKEESQLSPDSQNIQLDAGTVATDTDKMWRKNVEDKQEKLDQSLNEKMEAALIEMNKKAADIEQKKDEQIRYLTEKVKFLQAEIEDSKLVSSTDNSTNIELEKAPKIATHTVNLTNDKSSKEYEPLKTAENFIPAGTMVKAATLNGLRASTAVRSMSNPDEIIIELLDYGILPNHFRNNVKDCRVVADAYGELSSETVKIRTSKLSCIELKTGESIETDLVGMVVGPDGYAGIKGTVVSIDQKYLANASIFGIMSGLANVGVKDNSVYNPFTIGTGAVKPMTDKQKIGNNLMSGASSSLDKLSDYYIEHAERIQPVIEIDAGRPVTIAVLKGTYFGTSTLKKALSKKREEDIEKTAANESKQLLDEMEIR